MKRALYTFFYTGYSPVAPGTAGTLAAALVYGAEYLVFGKYCWISNAVIVAVLFFPSIFLCGAGERDFGEKDPSKVVLDEAIGYWVSVMFHPFSLVTMIAAFFLFRIADIVKPFPVKRLENIRGGTGILMDDVVAGVYTNLLLVALTLAYRYYSGRA